MLDQPRWLQDDVLDLYNSASAFFASQAVPHFERWAEQKHVDREFWRECGKMGFLCTSVPEEYGGGGGSFLHDAAIQYAYSSTGDRSWGNTVHSGVVANYLAAFGTEEQKRAWLPGMASGDLVGAIAMTEPGAGSDLKALQTRAVRDGDSYVLNGTKTFITNGTSADLVVVAVRTSDAPGAKGISLVVLETDGAQGFTRSAPLRKLGQHGADTAELHFDDVRVPVANLLGEEGRGFAVMMGELPRERLVVGITAVAVTRLAVELAVEHAKSRELFGAPLIDMQHTRFELAECTTLATVGRAFLDDCMDAYLRGGLTTQVASMCKWWLTDVQVQVIDRCLQLFGGYGYMTEYPIARLYADARAQKIYGGTNEVQKEIIARSL